MVCGVGPGEELHVLVTGCSEQKVKVSDDAICRVCDGVLLLGCGGFERGWEVRGLGDGADGVWWRFGGEQKGGGACVGIGASGFGMEVAICGEFGYELCQGACGVAEGLQGRGGTSKLARGRDRERRGLRKVATAS